MPATQEALSRAKELGLRPERLAHLDAMLTRWVADDVQPTIAVKALRHGVPIFEGIYGSSFTDVPLSYDTIFPVMSISKPAIAILLHILQEDGLVDLIDPVRYYMPEYVKGGRDKICLWHLLSHISGVPEYDDMDNYIRNTLGIIPPEEGSPEEEWKEYHMKAHKAIGLPPCEDGEYGDAVFKHLYENMPIADEPGTVMKYNSRGYDVARDVIVKVTGESIDSYAKRVLFDPLGMNDSYWKLPEDKWNRVVGRKERVLGYPWATEKRCFESESGGGGLKSTVNDFVKLMEMMRCYGEYKGVRVLSPASVSSMARNHNTGKFTEYDAWGLGWGIHMNKKDDCGTLCSAHTIEHGGWAGTKIHCDYDNDITYAYFSLIYEYDEKTRPEDQKFYRPRFTNVLTSALL